MDTFVGLDVSLKETSVCVLNQKGTIVFEGKVASEPKAIARLIREHAPNVVRVGLESGPTSVWLTHALSAKGLPLVCLDARPAKAVLSARPNKSDRSDARGLAEMIRVGWFKAVQVKSLAAHERKALLIARHQLVEMRVRIDNQLRGILKRNIVPRLLPETFRQNGDEDDVGAHGRPIITLPHRFAPCQAMSLRKVGAI